jgi:hypothetical protein
MPAPDYGPLKEVVTAGGSIIAAGGALFAAWRGRATFEPSAEDLPQGAQKVGGLLASLAIALMWVSWRDGRHNGSLVTTAIALGVLTFVFLIVYASLIGLMTYKVIEIDGSETRVVGGFWLCTAAKEKKQAGETTQEILEGGAYDVEKLWSRGSRQLAKLAFITGYLGLAICGTVALAAAAIRLGLTNTVS